TPSDFTALSAADKRSETPESAAGILAMEDSILARRPPSAAADADPASTGPAKRAGTSPASQTPKNTSATITALPSRAKNIWRAATQFCRLAPFFAGFSAVDSGGPEGGSSRGGSAA